MSREDGPEPEERDEDAVDTVVTASADPFERARAALRNAREARGIDPDAEPEEEEEPPPRDVESVLARAAAAREQAAVGRAGLEREARAREELARIKAGRSGIGDVSPPEATPSADAAEKDAPAGPRPRRL